MNRVYKVVFNHALGAWVAVSELTKSHKKRASATAVAVALLLVCFLPSRRRVSRHQGLG
ncbi:ESPR domain-containing protein [Neisseria sp. SLRRB23]|uniref:ESPR domain-containing protein n=1 Tax=Neisseria sp. SLRRB23 TaxID=3435199 RepID=UPI003D7F5D9F